MKRSSWLWSPMAGLILVFGCGGGSNGDPGISAAVAAGEKSRDGELSGTVAMLEVHKDDLDGMAERRVVRVLTTFNRTAYFLDGGEPKGATAEGARLFEEFLNQRLGMTGKLRMTVAIVPVLRDELLPALAAGKGDIASANLTITDERLKTVAFGDPFLTGVKEVVVVGPKSPALETLDDLAGEEIWVRASSAFYESLTELSERLVGEGHEAIDIRAADELLETEDLLQMVAAGILPLTVADSHIADFWGSVVEGLEVRSDLALSEDRQIAWAFRKNSPKLEAAVNDFVRKHKKGTMLGNVILKRYLQDNKWVRNPAVHQARFDQLRPSFERWAEEYNSDWLLAAAQGYQESQLDQSKRSRAGAIGVMQMKPTTAADPNVGIPDISEADANIHAGIKYARFLADRYYADEPMTNLNKGLFAVASYNAGPARIRQFRQQATEKGLDPNVWFNNVEQLASRETVEYVRNVFKYYFSYREALRRESLKEQ